MPGHLRRIGHRTRAWARALWIACSVAGCGGGVDSGGTGAPQASFASGPITGFGSIIVNGVHYDDRTARIADADGNVRGRDDLKLGMTTEIDGTAVVTDADASISSTATNIVYGSSVLGPITRIDTAAGTMVVLGHTVAVTASTVFDARLNGGLAALSSGDLVEVYALADATQRRYVATRIERRASASAYVLRSVVGNVNAAARTFELGGQSVSYSGLPAGDSTTTPVNGQFLRVQLATVPLGSVWQAVRLRADDRQLDDHEEGRVEGLINAYTSSAQFSVDGIAVDASAASFPDGTAGLALGVRVAVEGKVQGGVLGATKVRIKSDSSVENEGFELDGVIDSIDAAKREFVLRGVAVDYSGSVDFRDGTPADLAVDRRVEVRGPLSGDGTRLQAQRIRFRQ